MSFRLLRWPIAALAVCVPAVAFADLTLPYTFTSGTPIRAAEVNSNFETLRAVVGSPNVSLGANPPGAIGPGADYASITGGNFNEISDDFGVVGGGEGNSAGDGDANDGDAAYATVSGGFVNLATAEMATISGGSANQCSAQSCTIGGGSLHQASGSFSTIAGGNSNQTSGIYSTVPGGTSNTAAGANSFAAGTRAKANNQGCFVWGDSTNSDVTCGTNNRWVSRAVGGVYFYTNTGLTTGSFLAAGSGTWASVSDRNEKLDFSSVDTDDVLAKVRNLPLSSWRYKSEESGARHVGPMAQDFHAAFGLGDSDRHITTIDADGIALAAIQGLDRMVNERVERLEREVSALRSENEALRGAALSRLEQENAALKQRLARIERALERR